MQACDLRRSFVSSSQSQMKIERLSGPFRRRAWFSRFCRGDAASFLRMTEGGTKPAAIEAFSRKTSSRVVLDDIHVDGSSDQRVERFVSRIAINDKEPAIAEIADTGNEPVAKGVEHGERRFGGASGIGCVLIDFDGAFVVKEAGPERRGLRPRMPGSCGRRRKKTVGSEAS